MDEEKFLKDTLTKDIKKDEKEGLSDFMETSFTKELRKAKLTKVKKKEFKDKQKKTLKWFIGFALFIIILALLLIYFIVISPTFIFKPDIEKPEGKEIAAKELQYIANELGAYKLHFSPLDGKGAQFEIFINDKGVKYTISVDKTYPNAIKAEAPYPDIRIISNEDTLMELFKSEDIQKTAAEYYQKNLIAVEIIEDINTLTLKGYKQIYEDVTQESGVWKLLVNSRPIRTTIYLTIVILLCIFTFWYLRYK